MRPHELRAARKSFGMTQTEFGEWLGLKAEEPRRSVHDYEAGRRLIPGPVALAVTLEIECRKLREAAAILGRTAMGWGRATRKRKAK